MILFRLIFILLSFHISQGIVNSNVYVGQSLYLDYNVSRPYVGPSLAYLGEYISLFFFVYVCVCFYVSSL